MFYERLKTLAKEKNKSLNEVEFDLGFSKNSLYHTKKYTPQGDKLAKLAEYFDDKNKIKEIFGDRLKD